MKSVVFLDLDGTLWNHENIPGSARLAIKEAQKNGHLILCNTGRSFRGVSSVLWELGLDGQCLSAGSEIWMNGRRIVYHPLEPVTVNYLLEKLTSHPTGITMEGSKENFINPRKKEFLIKFSQANREGKGFAFYPDLSQMQDLDKEQIMKVSIHSQHDFDLAGILAKAPQPLCYTSFKSSLSSMNDLCLCGEITSAQFNKATAMDEVTALIHEPVRTIAIGDSENDLTMLDHADISVAMGNGLDLVKQRCTFTTTPLWQDGIYNAFKKLELI